MSIFHFLGISRRSIQDATDSLPYPSLPMPLSPVSGVVILQFQVGSVPRLCQACIPTGQCPSAHDISFAYIFSIPVICSTTVHIPVGKTTVIVDPSGCGKTTLYHLMARFFYWVKSASLSAGRLASCRHAFPVQRLSPNYELRYAL